LFERFTDQARRVVVLAQDEARILNHDYIGTEHILLGLSREEGVAAKALESLNISLEAVRRQVEEIIGRGPAPLPGHIPFTPRAKKVLELAFREAIQLGHDYIGTEHILLGLIREGEGVGAEVLQRLGADRYRVRRTVIQELSGSPAVRYGEMPSPSPFDEREKILLSLLIQEGRTTSDIAKLLGVSEEKVGEIIQALIAKLRDI
jgi:ATP-dependent Clp protease ATP-binding subunit ClpC